MLKGLQTFLFLFQTSVYLHDNHVVLLLTALTKRIGQILSEIHVPRYIIQAVTKFMQSRQILVSSDSSQLASEWIDAVKRLGIDVFDTDPFPAVDISNDDSEKILAANELSSMPKSIYKLFPDSLHANLGQMVSVSDRTPPAV